jgi:hypothetical protein
MTTRLIPSCHTRYGVPSTVNAFGTLLTYVQEGYPFLEAMIGYSRLAARIWRLVDYFEPAVIRELKPHDFEELDREILGWYESVPEEVRTDPTAGDTLTIPTGPYDLQRLRIWTWLRLTQVGFTARTPAVP